MSNAWLRATQTYTGGSMKFAEQSQAAHTNHNGHDNDQKVQTKEGNFAGWALPPEQARLPFTFSTLHPAVSAF
jgi:hypothetical protein